MMNTILKKKLSGGRVDIIPAELGNGLYITKKLEIKNVKPLLSNPLKRDGLYIIFNKKNVDKQLVETFSKELKRLKQEPIYSELYNEYFQFSSKMPLTKSTN